MDILKNFNLNKEELIKKLLEKVEPFEKRKVIRPRKSIKQYKYKELFPLDNQLINHLGGNTQLSKLLNISPMAISKWRKSGIPSNRILQLVYIYKI